MLARCKVAGVRTVLGLGSLGRRCLCRDWRARLLDGWSGSPDGI